jgi:LacI family transcriptional regulator
VSVATVSRYVNGVITNGPKDLFVREALEELGYVPNSAARALKMNESEQISVALPDISNPVYQAMISGIRKATAESRFRLVLSPSLTSPNDLMEHLNSLGKGFADGLILNTLVFDDAIVDRLKKLQIPTVLLGSQPSDLRMDNIQVDSIKGAQLAAEYLFSTGRDKVLFLNGPWMTNPAKRRKEGFLKAAKKFGVTNPERDVINAAEFNPTSAYETLAKLSKPGRYKAILCANDLLAAGALKFLLEHGYSVPDQIAIVGIDNTELGELLHPTLTSVDFKAEYRGSLAAKFLMERISDKNLPIRSVVVEPELILRDSA